MRTLFCFLSFFLAGFVYAEDMHESAEHAESMEEALSEHIPPKPEGAISWHVLGAAQIVYDDNEGIVKPQYTKEIEALNGKEISLAGYLFPVESEDPNRQYLFAALPPSCPFCLPAGPNYVADLQTVKPLKHTEEAVHLKGRLKLLDGSGQYQLFFLLEDVVQLPYKAVKPPKHSH